MAQWQELLKLDSALQGQVIQLYETKFPRMIRHYLSGWIEGQDWDLAALDEQEARNRFHELLVHLGQQQILSVQQNNILQGPDFGRIKDYLQRYFEENPLNLALILSECLKKEKEILASACGAQGSSSSEFDNRVKELRKRTWEVEREIKSLENLNDQLDFLQRSYQSEVEQHSDVIKAPPAVPEKECREQTNFITQTKQIVLQEIGNILTSAQLIVNDLTVVELPGWKRRQQLASIGGPEDTCLLQLQTWFTTAAEALQHVRQQLQKLQELNKKYDSSDDSNLLSVMAEIEAAALSMLTKLLANALVVEEQPCMLTPPQRPLMLKTGVRFTMKVRFLANLPEFKGRIQVKPEFDKDVEEVKTITGFRRFTFTRHDRKVLDVDTPNGGLVAEFGHLSLKELKGRIKGSSDNCLAVIEELHIIKFETKLQIAGLECNIEASSLPLVVISSSIQINSAWASIMWSNMLLTSEPWDLSLFLDPPALTWPQLSEVLSWQFLSVGERELNESQLSVLRDKIVDNPDDLVQWKEFHKNAWIWIYGILDLIKKHLKDLWRDGYIMGFVSKKTADLMLREKQSGNFLLRFSETNKEGAISVSWVQNRKGEAVIRAVDPFTKTDLAYISLVDNIKMYKVKDNREYRNPLLYLYPDIPKDAIFGTYSEPAPKNTGYESRPHIPVTTQTLSLPCNDPTPPQYPTAAMPIMDTDTDTDMDITPAGKYDCDNLLADVDLTNG
ncbi:signal transducer and activator of transcription 1-alpha/beta-like [Genypterus blacodes]|uniref:signal transducer and activator of transcription 1-alpha/beta-like n=1 Tax=Genypterus blacodes TaxID=154954 RepID=UPI003F76663D